MSENIEAKIGNLNVRYLKKYENLLRRYSQFGGGAEANKFIQARYFSNVYQFYIYAFFIGLSTGRAATFEDNDKLETFWEMKNWKPRDLVDNLLVCAIAKSDFDMFKIQLLDDSEISKELSKLRHTIEQYANGGLDFIVEQVGLHPDEAEGDFFFTGLLTKNKAD